MPTESLFEFILWVLGPVGFGWMSSQLNSNWAWFKNLESGQKSLFLTLLSGIFGAIYYFVSDVMGSAFFNQFNNAFMAAVPFLVFFFSQLGWQSTVNTRREIANGDKVKATLGSYNWTYSGSTPPTLYPLTDHINSRSVSQPIYGDAPTAQPAGRPITQAMRGAVQPEEG